MRAQRPTRQDVRARGVAHEPHVAAQVHRAVRRPAALDVALEPEDARLVDRDPPLDEVARLSSDMVGIVGQTRHDLRVAPAAQVGEPARAGEMVQRDHRLDARLFQAFELSPIRVQSGLIEAARLGLDARPLDRHSIGIQTDAAQERDVFGPAIPGIARVVRAVR